MSAAKQKLKTFCEQTSISGVEKIFNSPSRALRWIWCIYVLIMITIMLISIGKVVVEYLRFDTIQQTEVLLNHDTEYPSLTFCKHHSFGKEAYKLWKQKKVMSPREMNRKLLNISYQAALAGDQSMALWSFPFMDSKNIYYQMMDLKTSLKLGANPKDFFQYCLKYEENSLTYGNFNYLCGLSIKIVSVPNYFNCFTVKFTRESHKMKVNRLTLILNVRSKPDFKNYEQGFVNEVFDQAYGVRMLIHEPDTYPFVKEKGIHIEPGKLAEISFSPVRRVSVSSPKRKCLTSEETQKQLVKDLNLRFRYSFDGCLSEMMGQKLLKECGCYYSQYLRPGIPNATYPYCGANILEKGKMEKFTRIATCLGSLDLKSMRRSLKGTKCQRPCTSYEYRTRHSITKWRSTDWQLHWINTYSGLISQLYQSNSLNKTARAEAEDKIKKTLLDNIKKDDLTNIPALDNNFQQNPDDFIYVTLIKENNDLIEEGESLSISLAALFSNIGGLCGLFLGLSCAFFVELLEFFYLSAAVKQTRRDDEVTGTGAAAAKESARMNMDESPKT